MARMAAVAAAVFVAGPVAAAQDDFGQPTIVVVGYGDAEARADFGEIEFQINGEGRAETDALRALKTVRERVESGLTSLTGVTAIGVEIDGMSVDELRGPDCNERNYDDRKVPSTGACAVIGHLARAEMKVRIVPATQVGNAASMAAQLGGVRVRIEKSGVRSYAALEAEAARKALAQARHVAEAVAQAQGVKLGPILRVQSHEAVTRDLPEELVVTGSRVPGERSPEVLFDMKAPLVGVSSTYTVVYAIAR